MGDDFEAIELRMDKNADALGHGPLTAEELPETVRSIRHFIANDHMSLQALLYMGRENRRLVKKSLAKTDLTDSRIDDVIGVEGQHHIDGGGAVGRLEARIVEVIKAVSAQATQNKWIIGLLISVALGLFALAGVILVGHHG